MYVRDTAVKISDLFHRKQILLVNFRPVIYVIGSSDLYWSWTLASQRQSSLFI